MIIDLDKQILDESLIKNLRQADKFVIRINKVNIEGIHLIEDIHKEGNFDCYALHSRKKKSFIRILFL